MRELISILLTNYSECILFESYSLLQTAISGGCLSKRRKIIISNTWSWWSSFIQIRIWYRKWVRAAKKWISVTYFKFLPTLDFTILISQLQPTIQIWRKGWKRTTERKIWIFWQIWWLKSCELFCRSLCWFPCWGSWCTWISSLEFRNMIQRSTV